MTADDARPVHGIEVPYRFRFDECGPDGLARTSALLRDAQDIAWIHSERLGFGRDWYAERGLAWVVRATDLVVLAPVPLGTTLAFVTTVTGFRRVMVRRRTEARLPDGTLAMWGHTDWVITDARGLPGRVPPEFLAGFDTSSMPFEPERVRLPPAPVDAVVHRALVRPQDLDPMGHVNNAAYLDYLEEALHAAGPAVATLTTTVPRRIRLEYLAAASPGASLVAAAWPFDPAGGDGTAPRDGVVPSWAWRLADADGRELARGTAAPDGG